MNKIQEILPPPPEPGQGMSEIFNPHTAELEQMTYVHPLASLRGANYGLRQAITTERRKHARQETTSLMTILGQNEAIERARIDPVTGLGNRVAYEEQLPLIFERKAPGELTIVYVDVNGLSRINNSLGHKAGDKYLAAKTKAVQTGLRPTDLGWRIGGDEEVFALDGHMEEDYIDVLADRLQARAGRAATMLGIPKNLYPGLSVGVAIKRADDTLESFVERADAAVEASKEKFYEDIEERTGLNLRRKDLRSKEAEEK